MSSRKTVAGRIIFLVVWLVVFSACGTLKNDKPGALDREIDSINKRIGLKKTADMAVRLDGLNKEFDESLVSISMLERSVSDLRSRVVRLKAGFARIESLRNGLKKGDAIRSEVVSLQNDIELLEAEMKRLKGTSKNCFLCENERN